MSRYDDATARRRFAAFFLAAAAALTLGACGDDETGPEPEPAVRQMRIQVGAQTINVDVETGAVTGAPLRLTAGTPAAVSVQFLRADGSLDPVVTATGFRLDVASSNPSITFARSGPFAGSLSATQKGATGALTFSLFHLGEGHAEFDRAVPVEVS